MRTSDGAGGAGGDGGARETGLVRERVPQVGERAVGPVGRRRAVVEHDAKLRPQLCVDVPLETRVRTPPSGTVPYSYGLQSYGLDSYGLCSDGLYICGLYSHGLHSYGPTWSWPI